MKFLTWRNKRKLTDSSQRVSDAIYFTRVLSRRRIAQRPRKNGVPASTLSLQSTGSSSRAAHGEKTRPFPLTETCLCLRRGLLLYPWARDHNSRWTDSD
jgi:hypothetical protein